MLKRGQALTELRATRIVVVKPSALGDIVHALPILGALRAKFPEAHLAWVVNRSYQSLIDGHHLLNETIPFDRGAVRGGLKQAARVSFAFCKELRRRRFDLAIDLQGLARSGLMTLATGARQRIGLGTAREGAHLAYTQRIATPFADQQHAIDRYWLLAEALGVGQVPKRFDVPVHESAHEWAEREWREFPRPWLAFGVGARWLTKRWQPQHFAELLRRAQATFGGTAFFVGAADESALAEEVRAQVTGPTRNYCGTTNLQQLAALLQHADAMVSNDTGPLHLAVALGRPCVAPYTCTLVRKHGPYGQDGGIETTVVCKGSYIRTCDRLDCMKELVPERLWPSIRGILQTWASNSRSA